LFSVLGNEPRALHMLGKHFITEVHPQLLLYGFLSKFEN
jgi:hypothetical protein